MKEKWIEKIIEASKEVVVESETKQALIQTLIDCSYNLSQKTEKDVGLYLAASFDLVVAADYYSAISNSNWLYCPGIQSSPCLLYHFTNCCPLHVLHKDFIFNPANKPPSGKIGRTTSRLLLSFYQEIFARNGRDEKILIGHEPVDVVIVDNKKKKALFAEIKASPLLTLPICMTSEELFEDGNGEKIPMRHQITNNTNLVQKDLFVMLPVLTKGNWKPKKYNLGRMQSVNDTHWAEKGFLSLLQDESFFSNYTNFWFEALRSYSAKDQIPIFWFTNACGTPSPTPPNWAKRRVGSGYESISDTKTSVGMDRTDDIKKGIFQTLKMGSMGKVSESGWTFIVALISNIHAARHFDEYLGSLKDIVWTLDTVGNVKKVSDLPPDQELHNLCDGIVALTSTFSRDEWINEIFEFKGLKL